MTDSKDNIFQLSSASRKGTPRWFARAAASRLTRLYVTRLCADRSAVVYGYPRSGTSWISKVISEYYDLPCYRHFVWPRFCPQVLHTHDIEIGLIRRVIYMVRSPYDSYVSLFVKRYGIGDPAAFGRSSAVTQEFKSFLKQEVKAPYEAPCRWSDHVGQAVQRHGNGAIVPYSTDLDTVMKSLSDRIIAFEGDVDADRLGAIVGAKSTGAEPTTRTSAAAKQFCWYDREARAIVAAEIDRLKSKYPAATSLCIGDTLY